MSTCPTPPASDATTDPLDKRILIFVVAYNAASTLASVLDRIPASLHLGNVEVLVIDDFSKDTTFAEGVQYQLTHSNFRIPVLRTPVNQGYGGNQKLGYRYAIDQGFDIVALVHGDGQYAPEKLPDLLGPLVRGEADAAFGSRMLDKGGALRGGMPLYKFVGNKILTAFQNRILGTHFSEFHSGYRLFSTAALRRIPFERNTDDFHFDTEIMIQFVLRGLRISELPIPTYYGEEICYVNGMKYAWDVARTMLRARVHQADLLYDRKYDFDLPEETYDLKLGFPSSHTMAVDAARPDAHVLDVGCGRGLVAREFAKKGCMVTGLDQYAPKESPMPGRIRFLSWDLDEQEFPTDVSEFDQVFLLDIIEHLKDPERFMEILRHSAMSRRPEIILTTANIGFFVTRLMLLLGQFNYGRKGILDRTHTRLFTFRSLRELFVQTGYRITEMRGIPAPFPKAIGLNRFSRLLIRINLILIRLLPGLFSYQIFVHARAVPTVSNLLHETREGSRALRDQVVSGPQPA